MHQALTGAVVGEKERGYSSRQPPDIVALCEDANMSRSEKGVAEERRPLFACIDSGAACPLQS